jgi:drug/metabolite transporter superfamily protein YnfA
VGDAGADEFYDVRPARAADDGRGEGPSEPGGPRGAAAGKAAADTAAKKLRPAHAFTFAGLFLFTFVLFYRPYEYIPLPTNLAFWFAALTLAVFVPSQLAAEGSLTARPREVNLVLLLVLAGLLSIPFAKGSRGEAWATFGDIFIRAVLIFIVIVNAVRTERRLRWMLLLSVGSAVALGAAALYDFRAGRLTVEGYRVEGSFGGIFENPNDMALHLVTMTPVALALGFGARGLLRKALYWGGAALMVAGTVVTYSRGGFLALAASTLVLAWTLGRRNRLAVVAAACVLTLGLLLLAPGNYGARIFSIYDRSLDAYGSADARQALLMRSVLVAIRNPLFGVGMGNFAYVSFRSQVTHNAYTQVAAEMGAAALVVYTLYVVTPLRRLRAVVRETFDARRASRFYYLAAGLSASLVGYMVASFFASVAYYWNVYYLVGYAVCLHRLYEASGEAPSSDSRGGATRAETRGEGEAVAVNV